MTAAYWLITLLVCGAQAGGDKAPPPGREEIRRMLEGEEFDDYEALVALGARAFPAYLQILAAKDADRSEASRIFLILSKVKADRGQFLEPAIANLAHPHSTVRYSAVQLLGQIGNERDAAPVVALLSDEEWTIPFAAAKTLAAIGDRRVLTAMDVWLNSVKPHNSGGERANEILRQHVIKCRHELKERLDKAKKLDK